MPHAFLIIVCGYCVLQPVGSEVLEHTAVTALGAEERLGCADGDRETCSWRTRHACETLSEQIGDRRRGEAW